MPFDLRNVETDLGAYHDLLARGFRTVPVTIVGDDPGISVKGFKEAELRTALGLS